MRAQVRTERWLLNGVDWLWGWIDRLWDGFVAASPLCRAYQMPFLMLLAPIAALGVAVVLAALVPHVVLLILSVFGGRVDDAT